MGNEGGQVWEHLLLLIPCPFLALSATIGNAVEFHLWLVEIEKQKGRKIYFIEHSQRFNDLQYFSLQSKSSLVNFNPIHVLLNFASNVEFFQKQLKDLKFLPEDSFDLYVGLCFWIFELVKKFSNQEKQVKILRNISEQLIKLNPLQFFSQNEEKLWSLSMKECSFYEIKLKEILLQIAKENLQEPLFNQFDFTKIPLSSSPYRPLTEKLSFLDLLDLFKSLQMQEKLPLICFLLNRQKCEKIVTFIVGVLKKNEKEKKKAEGVFERINALKEQSTLVKLNVDKIKEKSSSQITPEDEEVLKKYENILSEIVDLESRMPEFCFVSKKNALSQKDLNDFISFNHQQNMSNQLLIEGLLRGIGVHHAGLPKKYRQAVERLFRLKKIGVIVATGTLALGLNMPAKTVLFLEDALFINTMTFR